MTGIAVDVRMARISGIGRYIREVVPRVVSEADGWDVTLLGDPVDIPRWIRPGGRVAVRGVRSPIYSLTEQLELPGAIPRGTDLLWSPHYNIPLVHRGRLIVTVHDVLHLARPEFVRGTHRRRFSRILYGAVRRNAVRVLCDSRFTADELIRWAGVDPGVIEVVHLGVGQEWFRKNDTPSSRTRPYFLYVGNVKPHKNLRGLIRAFGSLVEAIPHDLVIVGRRDGFISGDPEVVRSAEALGDRCAFTGELGDDEVRAYVAGAEALVIPSFYEGFGLPAVEAMAAGCPVLASNAASLPEVCGDAALYFDPARVGEIAHCLRTVVETPQLGDELAAAGRERARRYTWERCARSTFGVIRSALEARTSHR